MPSDNRTQYGTLRGSFARGVSRRTGAEINHGVKPLSELDDVSNLEMQLIRLDLWQENNFLLTFEKMECLSEQIGALCDSYQNSHPEQVDQVQMTMSAPKAMERCTSAREAAFDSDDV